MSIEQDLLGQIIEAARLAQLDQARLAAAAGVAPETISRAKKRGAIDFGTLQALAGVVGLSLALKRADTSAAPNPAPTKTSPGTLDRSSLAHPSHGLTWSNPHVSDEVLVRNALKRGSFYLLLDASLEHGVPFVKQQWELMKSDASVNMSEWACAEVERKLANIDRGIRHAQT